MTTAMGLTPKLRGVLVLAGLIGAWAGVLCALRFGLLEIPPEADPCLADPSALACRWRAMLGLAIHFQVFGWLALAASLLAWLLPARRRRMLGTATLFLAVLALVLYNVRYGAPAAVLALLACVPEPSRADGA